MALIAPYGGHLVNLLVPAEQQAELRAYANHLPSLQLSERAVCDLELLACGAFSPLAGFMGQADYERVVAEMRLTDGQLFPIPVTLPVPADAPIRLDGELALRNAKNELLAIMRVEELYRWDYAAFVSQVLGSSDLRHPLVAEAKQWGEYQIAGRLQVLQLPPRYDFRDLRLTPAQTRERLVAIAKPVVAFQTRNPLHRAHEELTKRAMQQVDAALLLHPVVGLTKPGDIDYYLRVRSYRAVLPYYDPSKQVLLALLPLAMRMAGPREALWHALIRRNYGASHFIVGRDHASPGLDSTGQSFYGPFVAQELVAEYAQELGVQMLAFGEMVYLPDEQRYEELQRLKPGVRAWSLSGTQVREQFLARGEPLPEWFTHRETAEILQQAYPIRRQQGFCLWFTGLSGAGKSTIAEIVGSLLLEHGRQSTELDGDVVRTHLSKGLGFSRADRDTNVLRIAFVASELVRHRGVAICAAVSPYRDARNQCRALVGSEHFIEIFVDTPLAVCEARDTKGMYAKARRGEIKGFTGIDDPYEQPLNPDLVLNTVDNSPEACAQQVINLLKQQGWL